MIIVDRLPFPLLGNNISRIQTSKPIIIDSWRENLQLCYYGFRRRRYLRGRCHDRGTPYCYSKHISNSTFKVSIKSEKKNYYYKNYLL